MVVRRGQLRLRAAALRYIEDKTPHTPDKNKNGDRVHNVVTLRFPCHKQFNWVESETDYNSYLVMM